MTLKSDTKFEGKMTCGFENDMRDLANFHQSTESVEIGTFMRPFCPKQKMYELRIYRGALCHDNEE